MPTTIFQESQQIASSTEITKNQLQNLSVNHVKNTSKITQNVQEEIDYLMDISKGIWTYQFMHLVTRVKHNVFSRPNFAWFKYFAVSRTINTLSSLVHIENHNR